jgi:hypothetical protein
MNPYGRLLSASVSNNLVCFRGPKLLDGSAKRTRNYYEFLSCVLFNLHPLRRNLRSTFASTKTLYLIRSYSCSLILFAELDVTELIAVGAGVWLHKVAHCTNFGLLFPECLSSWWMEAVDRRHLISRLVLHADVHLIMGGWIHRLL